MWRTFIDILLLLLILTLPSALIAEDLVTSIRFVSNIKIDEEELKSIISLKELSHPDPYLIDRSIKELYETGLFKAINVTRRRTEKGIEIIFYLTGRDVIRKIEFSGNKFIKDKRLMRNIPLEVNTLYNPENIKESITKIKELYRDSGFITTKVTPRINGKGEGEVVLSFIIDEGVRKKIDRIQIECTDETARQKMLKKFRYADDYYDKAKFDKALQETIGFLIDAGYWNARFSVPELIYDKGEDKLIVRVNVDPGPCYTLRFSGNSHFSTDELLKVINFEERSDFSSIMLDDWKRRLVYFYQKNGFPKVSIEVVSTQVDNQIEIQFKIDEGIPMRIEEIKFIGNRSFKDSELRSLMLTRERGIFSGEIDFLYDWIFDYYPKGILIDERLKEDIENIEYFYKKEGFVNSKVNLKSIEYNMEKKSITINIAIKEGERFYISDIEFFGNKSFSSDELKKVVKLEREKPFNPWEVDDGVKLLKNFYDDKGYIFSKIENENVFLEGSNNVIVKYNIEEGIQAHVNKIYLIGNKKTKGYVLRRELTFEEEDVLTPKKVFESQRKLYRLGFIDRVSIDIKDVEPDGKTDLEVKVKESKMNRVDLRFGYGTAEGLRSSLEFTKKNLGGRGQTIFFRADISYWLRDLTPFSDIFSSEENYFNTRIFNVGFIWPWLFRQNMDFRINLINQERRRIYQLKSNDVVLGIERDLTKHFHGGVQYQLRFRDPLGDGSPDLRYEDKRRLGFLSLFLFHDTRNNPFEPVRGHLQTYKVDFASRNLAPKGEYDYLKFFVKGDFFTSPMKKLVTAFSIRSGYGYLLGKVDIPIEERFFLGGTTSVRGFEEDSLGPKVYNQDTNEYVPAGGDFMLGYNVELRFALRKGLGFVLFTDGGNVWANSSDADFGRIIRFKDLRESAGLGFRYATPIGPLRLDLGLKLDKRKDEPLNEWHFFIGNMF